jgi:hypothetical protein
MPSSLRGCWLYSLVRFRLSSDMLLLLAATRQWRHKNLSIPMGTLASYVRVSTARQGSSGLARLREPREPHNQPFSG